MPHFTDDWDEQEAMIGEELARREEEVDDLDPHRTVTHLVNGVPYCYLGHPECYDRHETERLTDEVDCEEDRERRGRNPISSAISPCEHLYGEWARPIGQVKIRQCSRCGHVQTWDAHLQEVKKKDEDSPH